MKSKLYNLFKLLFLLYSLRKLKNYFFAAIVARKILKKA